MQYWDLLGQHWSFLGQYCDFLVQCWNFLVQYWDLLFNFGSVPEFCPVLDQKIPDLARTGQKVLCNLPEWPDLYLGPLLSLLWPLTLQLTDDERRYLVPLTPDFPQLFKSNRWWVISPLITIPPPTQYLSPPKKLGTDDEWRYTWWPLFLPPWLLPPSSDSIPPKNGSVVDQIFLIWDCLPRMKMDDNIRILIRL